MSNLSLTVTSLQSKIEKLVNLHKQIQADYVKLNTEKTSLEKQLSEQRSKILMLEEKNKQIKLAKTITETNENTLDIKLKINELVREIDKCIALLNR